MENTSVTKKTATSCGTMIFRKIPNQNEWEICAIYKEHQNRPGWVLPKGGNEEGETFEQTAIRETREETGIQNVVLVKSLDDSSYTFVKDGVEITKTVKWFWAMTDYVENQELLVGTTAEEKLTQTATKWIPVKEALEGLREESDRIRLQGVYQQIVG